MLEMTRETRDKLRTYLINADPFLWDVLDSKNKKGRLQELKTMGYLAGYTASANPPYAKINHDLLIDLGIEGILDHVVIPRVRLLFTSDIIDYFRRYWEQGQTPTFKYLREHGLYRRRYRSREIYEDSENYEKPSGYKDPSFVFVQIETQQNFVERWTVFAGLWFEEIEPLMN